MEALVAVSVAALTVCRHAEGGKSIEIREIVLEAQERAGKAESIAGEATAPKK